MKVTIKFKTQLLNTDTKSRNKKYEIERRLIKINYCQT